MGLNQSADLMDYILWSNAEQPVLNRLHEFGIRKRWRYRDDILICGRYAQRRSVWNAVKELKRQSGYFEISIEDVSRCS